MQMKKSFTIGFFLLVLFVAVPAAGLKAQSEQDMKFTDARELMVIGKAFEKSIGPYGRLPETLEKEFRKDLIYLGRNSAGVAVRFSSDSPEISARWTLTNNLSMNHMAPTGIKGLDLYVLQNGEWKFIGTARPSGKENFSVFVKGMDRSKKEFLAYLPLYDGVESLQIGIEKSSSIGKPESTKMTRSTSAKPLVIYGTSITQGGCASRPGMAYPSILGRLLNREVINFGFSGNGRLDFSMSKTLAMTDPGLIVMDCLPNTTTQSVKDSAYRFISNILKSHPAVPIYMVENPNFAHLIVDRATADELQKENVEWRAVYNQLRKEGYKNVHYIKADNFFGTDNEGTVDGVHPTDLGMQNEARKLYESLKKFRVK